MNSDVLKHGGKDKRKSERCIAIVAWVDTWVVLDEVCAENDAECNISHTAQVLLVVCIPRELIGRPKA